MSVQLIPVPQARIGAPFVTGVLAVVFASGVVTGLSLPRAVESGSQVAALHDPAVQVPAFPGVADNNMSDAAYAALHDPTVQVPAFPGVADNNMSDAVYAALHRPTDDSSD